MYVLLAFLETNGIRLDVTDDEIIRVGFDIASGNIDYDAILEWIIENE